MTGAADPHAGMPVAHDGRALGEGAVTVILLHGRNASPANIVEIARRLDVADATYLMPAAAGRTWYPHTFLAAREANEPALSSALALVDRLVGACATAGVPRSRVVLMGFSQGACLSAEYVYRHPARYGGLVAFSGGLVGPPGTTWTGQGGLDGTPAFLGCSDIDGHVPKDRVEESADALTRLGAAVTLRLYPGMGHLVNEDEIAWARAILDRAAAAPA
ncbi:MAG: alpha/beta hydrolase [Vicinamibacterales bacterium]